MLRVHCIAQPLFSHSSFLTKLSTALSIAWYLETLQSHPHCVPAPYWTPSSYSSLPYPPFEESSL